MATIPPVNLFSGQKFYKTLIYQITSMQTMIGPLTAQTASSKLTQVRHQLVKELLSRILVPVSPFMQKQGDVFGAGWHNFIRLLVV
jgi:hypothetical protein